MIIPPKNCIQDFPDNDHQNTMSKKKWKNFVILFLFLLLDRKKDKGMTYKSLFGPMNRQEDADAISQAMI